MIVVKLELHRAADGAVLPLGQLRITNDGSGSRTVGHYDVRQLSAGSAEGTRMVRRSRVTDHPRERVSAWKLVRAALAALGH